MKIGVLSDTHGRKEITALAVEQFKLRGIEHVFHCGDIEGPDMIPLFAGLIPHFVFGNWDFQRVLLSEKINEIGGTVSEEWGDIELHGRRIGWTHSHRRGELQELVRSGEFDFVFYGHTHTKESHRTGPTLVLNPGALFRANPKTVAIVDLETNDVEWLEIPEPILPPRKAPEKT